MGVGMMVMFVVLVVDEIVVAVAVVVMIILVYGNKWPTLKLPLASIYVCSERKCLDSGADSGSRWC